MNYADPSGACADPDGDSLTNLKDSQVGTYPFGLNFVLLVDAGRNLFVLDTRLIFLDTNADGTPKTYTNAPSQGLQFIRITVEVPCAP